MYNVNRDSGFAERQSWMQLNNSDVPSLTGEEGNGGENKDKRFAQLTYQINSVPISGNVNVESVGIDDTGIVGVSGDQLKTFDQGVINAVNNITVPAPVTVNYSSIIRVNGNFTYVMKSSIGSGTSGDAVWQIKRIEKDGDNSDILWADGNDNFDNVASDYASLVYSL